VIQVRLLGPFELIIDGETTVALSAPKLRRVLMLLVLHAGRVVSMSQFISELWEDRLPPSARTTLHTYIYQLRQLLGRVGETSGVSLERTADGYLLRLPPECVDAHRFTALVAQGRARLAEGQTLLGIQTLNEALSLWGAASMAESNLGSVLHAEAVRLEELRRAAVEERIEAELNLGQHHQAVGELLGLVASNPTHEGLQAKLMLALYRCGRRSEALDAYRRARSVLRNELGLEPCTGLRQLHDHVLTADPSLDLPEGTPVRTGTASIPPPSQLPPDVGLVGRRSQVEALRRALEDDLHVGRPVAVVTGTPASGKSALCVHAAHQVRANYPDGQLWAELTTPDGRPVPPEAVLGDFLRAVGLAPSRVPQDINERARMFRSWAADRRVLVVLDDVVDVDQLVPLLPGGSRSATLVTSRRRLSDPRITTKVAASPLPHAEAWDLLASALGKERLADEGKAVDQVIRLCQGLPGPLQTVARQLELRPHWSVARVLEDSKLLSLAPSFRRTYRLLASEVQSAFRALAAAGPVLTAEQAGAVLGAPTPVAEAVLEDLVEAQLADVRPETGSRHLGYAFSALCREEALRLMRASGPPGIRLNPGPVRGRHRPTASANCHTT
jgi:DNA-binding SARP family transcriptional activator